MNACVIKLDDSRLYVELPSQLVHELLADIVTRYERFFTATEPVYPRGKPELLYQALSEGYGLLTCSESLKLEVVDLRAVDVKANMEPDEQWKELHVGRILALSFASTLSCR